MSNADTHSIIFTSTTPFAGKTTIELGVASNIDTPFGYFKPYADRLTYKKKRLIDLDIALFKTHFGLAGEAEDFYVGFDYAKALFEAMSEDYPKRIDERFERLAAPVEMMIVESPKDFSYGQMIGLDAGSIAKRLGANVVLVATGEPVTIAEQCTVAKHHFEQLGVGVHGVIINALQEIDRGELEEITLPYFDTAGIEVFGIIPHSETIAAITVRHIVDKLLAKVVAGNDGLDNVVRSVLVGAMSGETAARLPVFKEPQKLVITGGDRQDMVLAALQTDSSCIVLTNNSLPHPRILSKADEKGIPVLSVPTDTYTAAKQIEGLRAEIKAYDTDKIAAVTELVAEHVDIDAVIGK